MKTEPKTVFKVHAGGDVPEHPDLSFSTTALQGGDAGHGANAEFALTSSMDSANFTVVIEKDDEKCFELEGPFVVRIIGRGDWEITGLAEALVKLGIRTWPVVNKRRTDAQLKINA